MILAELMKTNTDNTHTTWTSRFRGYHIVITSQRPYAKTIRLVGVATNQLSKALLFYLLHEHSSTFQKKLEVAHITADAAAHAELSASLWMRNAERAVTVQLLACGDTINTSGHRIIISSTSD